MDNSKINQWKQKLEELKLQAALGKMEAEEAFKEGKQKSMACVDQMLSQIEDITEEGEEKAQEIRSKMEALRVQLALGKAEGKEAILSQEEQIRKKMQELNYQLSRYYEQSKSKGKDWVESTEENLEEMKMRFDLFRLQAQLGSMEGKDLYEEKKADMQAKLHEMSSKIDSVQNKGDAKWQNFKSEIAEAWDHFKKAF